MAFFEDPRLRQRWNRISHNAEAATENAAASIWTFQHRYVAPCVAAAGEALESFCVTPCIGDREERARRRRERERARGRAEYSFDFYDDWYADYDEHNFDRETGESMGGRMFGRWRSEDWDRLLAGTGSRGQRQRGGTVGSRSGGGGDGDGLGASGRSRGRRGSGNDGGGEVTEQPRRTRGMTYGTREAARRKGPAEDPTIIPSTTPIGFLGRLPFRIGGTLRYKPSAADLQDHPTQHHPESQPLLGPDDFSDDGEDESDRDNFEDTAEFSAYVQQTQQGASASIGGPSGGDDDNNNSNNRNNTPGGGPGHGRKRSGTTGSGTTTSASLRSRGDLFPSDGEGDEDAIPLGDEFAVALDRVADDRSSARTRSSIARTGGRVSRTVSYSTIASPRRWSFDVDEVDRDREVIVTDGEGDGGDESGPASAGVGVVSLRVDRSTVVGRRARRGGVGGAASSVMSLVSLPSGASSPTAAAAAFVEGEREHRARIASPVSFRSLGSEGLGLSD